MLLLFSSSGENINIYIQEHFSFNDLSELECEKKISNCINSDVNLVIQ